MTAARLDTLGRRIPERTQNRYTTTAAETDWAASAACAQVGDPELWFPHAGQRATEAKLVCSRCTVQLECLDFALTHNIRDGIWGGVSENARDLIRRNRRKGLR